MYECESLIIYSSNNNACLLQLYSNKNLPIFIVVIHDCDWNLVYKSSLRLSFKTWLWVGLYQLFTPRLSIFPLIQDIHISSTLPISHYEYIKGLDKVEIGIHPPQQSPHTPFRAMICWNFNGPLHFTPRLSVYRLIQPFHTSSIYPISCE